MWSVCSVRGACATLLEALAHGQKGWVTRRLLSNFCRVSDLSGSLLQSWEMNGFFGVYGVQSFWLYNEIPQNLPRTMRASIRA